MTDLEEFMKGETNIVINGATFTPMRPIVTEFVSGREFDILELAQNYPRYQRDINGWEREQACLGAEI